MNLLIFGDLHITQNSLSECRLILNELLDLCKKYSISKIINLGDTFDALRPSSQELDLFAEFIKDLNRPITIIAANSHESENEQISILNHYGILSDNVTVVKEYIDGDHMYCGHFALLESNKSFGSKLSKEDLKDYLYVFLGHIHSQQMIKPNIVHLGSCRYVNFDEAKDKAKIVALITDYNGDKETVHFLKLKSPIPMLELHLGIKYRENAILDTQDETLEAQSPKTAPINPSNLRQNQAITDLISKLDKTDPNTKVKVKIMDFDSFRQFLPLSHIYINKFDTFKYETHFEVISDKQIVRAKNQTDTFLESFKKWLDNQQINIIIKDILLEEIK